MRICILERNPTNALNKMRIKRKWMPRSNPSKYTTKDYVYSLEVSSFYYIQKYYPDIDIDLLSWESITNNALMNKYDRIYIFNHGLSDTTSLWKTNANKYITAWKKLGKRAYPSYAFANFVLDKCKYYKFLNENNISTADTFCFKNAKNFNNLQRFLNIKEINKIFIKPIAGNSGRGTSVHEKPFDDLRQTIQTLLKNDKWNKLAIQRYMNFSTQTNPEYKCVFANGKLMYIVKTYKLGFFLGLLDSNDSNYKTLMNLSNKVIKLFEGKLKTSVLFCRVDWGYDLKYKKFFLNEFEHAGGTYGEEIVHDLKTLSQNLWNVDKEIAEAIIKNINTKTRNISSLPKNVS